MAGRGIQHIPIRFPASAPSWFKEWMTEFIRDVLSKLDIRNAIEGGGVSVTGNSDEVATLAADADIAALAALQYVVLALSGTVANERKLTTSAQIAVNDGGAGGNVTLTLADGAVGSGNLESFPALSALVRRADDDGFPSPVVAGSDGQVLRRGSDLVEFGALDLASANAVTGVLPDANIDAAIARDSEVTSAIAALSTVYQPLDSDLTSIAALTTAAFGRGLLELASFSALLDLVGSAANGDILYRSGGAWTRLPIGTPGQVLTVSAGNLPEWA